MELTKVVEAVRSEQLHFCCFSGGFECEGIQNNKPPAELMVMIITGRLVLRKCLELVVL